MINNEIKVIKEEIMSLIKEKREITKKTDYRFGGVYLLYVDKFENDNIIPIYIGQTSDFQDRHKEHLKEIYAINRFGRNYYKYSIFDNEFSGNYKSCKMFKYLVDNNCNLEDIKMIILEEENEESERKEIEFEYINKYLSSFVGFNQLNSITLEKNYKAKGQFCNRYLDIVKDDALKLIKYFNYGYCTFNYMLAYEMFEEYYNNEELLTIFNFKTIIEKKELHLKLFEEYRKLNRFIKIDSKEEYSDICRKTIRTFFEKNNLKSQEKQNDIIEYFVSENEKKKKEIDRYIERFAINKTDNIFDILMQKHGSKISALKERINETKEKMDKNYKRRLELINSVFEFIIPNTEYISYPLKDSYKPFEFEITTSNNVIYINIEFSNHGKKKRDDDYPDILKVDYLYINGDEKKEKSYFVKSVFDSFFEKDFAYIISKSMYKLYDTDPFNIRKTNLTGKYIDYSTISTSMEYYNGINEYTLIDKEKIDFKVVIKEIDSIINNETTIIYTSGCKQLIKEIAKCDIFKDSIIMKKFIKIINY